MNSRIKIFSELVGCAFLEFESKEKGKIPVLEAATDLKLEQDIVIPFSDMVGKKIFEVLTFIEEERVEVVTLYPFGFNVIYDSAYLINVKGEIKEGKLCVIARDYTKYWNLRKRVEDLERSLERKDKAIDQLEKKKAAAVEFSGKVIHDLKNPLSYIKGFSEVLKEGLVESDEVGEDHLEYLDYVIKGADKLGGLINELLELSRVKQGDYELEKVDLVNVFNDLKEEFKLAQEKSSANIQSDFQVGFLHANKSMIKSLLRNLISNSIKYAQQGKDPEIKIKSFFGKEGQIILSLEDNGVGIGQDNLEDIMKLFGQSSESNEGHGLGLNICHEIVKNLGGTLDIESELGVGTHFIICLPQKLNV